MKLTEKQMELFNTFVSMLKSHYGLTLDDINEEDVPVRFNNQREVEAELERLKKKFNLDNNKDRPSEVGEQGIDSC